METPLQKEPKKLELPKADGAPQHDSATSSPTIESAEPPAPSKRAANSDAAPTVRRRAVLSSRLRAH